MRKCKKLLIQNTFTLIIFRQEQNIDVKKIISFAQKNKLEMFFKNNTNVQINHKQSIDIIDKIKLFNDFFML